jgi:hypothetical protein
MTESLVLKRDIQTAIAELGRDREVFERAEINPEAIQRSVEKYGQIIPVALFDFWFDKHKSLEQRMEKLESQQGEDLLKSIFGYFKACIEASYVAGQQLTEIVNKYSYFSVNQVRAGLDFFNLAVKVMVLIKGNWPETEAPSEEAMNRLSSIESDFFSLEDKFTHEYSFAMFDVENKIQIRIEAHWLLMDSCLDTDSLTKDYPISVRC